MRVWLHPKLAIKVTRRIMAQRAGIVNKNVSITTPGRNRLITEFVSQREAILSQASSGKLERDLAEQLQEIDMLLEGPSST